MYFSWKLNPQVINEAGMVLFIPLVTLIGSIFGYLIIGKKGKVKYQIPSEKGLSYFLFISFYFTYLFFLMKYISIFNTIDFSSYTTLRFTFLVPTDNLIGIISQFFLWLDLILSGGLVAIKIQNLTSIRADINKEESSQINLSAPKKILIRLKKITNTQIGFWKSLIQDRFIFLELTLIILAGLVLPMVLTGSRSVALLFVASFIACTDNVFRLIKSKFFILVFAMLGFSLLGLGLIRGMSVYQTVLPWTAFLVGPHLLHQNMNTILSQMEILKNQVIPPGYALFSGLYLSINTISRIFGENYFQNNLETVFSARHFFDYIPTLHAYYNSYYSAGLAVVIEGWLQVGFLSFTLGFLVHFIRNSYAALIFVAILYYFEFSLFQYSIFQNPALSLLLALSIIVGIACLLLHFLLQFLNKNKAKTN